MRAVICKGDRTSHGGRVLEGNPNVTTGGRQVAQLGHATICPQCKGKFPIIEGVATHTYGGKPTAVEGMRTACGATLIASQRGMVIDAGGGGEGRAVSASPANVRPVPQFGEALGNAPGSNLAEQLPMPTAEEQRLSAMDRKVDELMTDVRQNGELLASTSTRNSSALISDTEQVRQAEMARITQQINEPPLYGADVLRVEISGVGRATPGEYNSNIIAAASSRGDDLRPTLANAERLGLANDPSLMSYADQMKNVGRFVGDLAVGAAKGLDNIIPETAAFAYRMTGYAAAGVVSLLDTNISNRMFAQYEKVTGHIYEYDNNVQAFGGTIGQIVAPTMIKGAGAVGARLYEAEQSAKLKINYDYRHWLSGTQTLSADTTFYAYKNSNYLAADYQSMQLWLTPELMTAEQAVQKLALPYAKGYDTLLTVTLPHGSKIMNPRPVWSLFGRPGGGIETRVYGPVTSDMYEISQIHTSKY